MNLSFAQLSMGKQLGIDSLAYGSAASIFFAAYILAEIPSNLLLVRFGARIWLARIVISWGVVTLATAWVQNLATLYMARFLLGVCEAGFYPGVIFYLSQMVPKRERANSNLLFLTAIPFASVLSSVISGGILKWFSETTPLGIEAWRWLFILEGVPTILLGLAFLKFLPDSIEHIKWLSNDEKRELKSAVQQEQSEGVSHHKISDGLRDWRVWTFALIGACNGCIMYTIMFWLPHTMTQFNIQNPSVIGLLNAVPWLTAFIVMLLTWRFLKTVSQPLKWITRLGLVCAIALAATVLGTVSPVLKLILISIATTTMMLIYPLYWAAINFVAQRAAAVVFAAVNSLASVSGLLAPWFMGWTIANTGSPILGTIVMALLMLAVATISARLRNHANRAATD